MKTLCDLNTMLDNGEIGKKIKPIGAGVDIHTLHPGVYYGTGATNAPDATSTFYFTVMHNGTGNTKVTAFNAKTGHEYVATQFGGVWQPGSHNGWHNTSGESAYDIWLKTHPGKTELDFLQSLIPAAQAPVIKNLTKFATHQEMVAGVVKDKAIAPDVLKDHDIMRFRSTATFSDALDSLRSYGIYEQHDGHKVTTAKNYPAAVVGKKCIIEVLGEGAGAIVQRLTTVGSLQAVFVRTHNGTSWGPWTEVVTEDTAFGHHKPVTVGPTTDWNKITKQGAYEVLHGYGANHSPTTWGTLVVFNSGNSTLTQIVAPASHNTDAKPLYVRTYTSQASSWTAWSTYGAMTLSGDTLTITL